MNFEVKSKTTDEAGPVELTKDKVPNKKLAMAQILDAVQLMSLLMNQLQAILVLTDTAQEKFW
jgi:hypothetical protein